jgi:hypothetical protein
VHRLMGNDDEGNYGCSVGTDQQIVPVGVHLTCCVFFGPLRDAG